MDFIFSYQGYHFYPVDYLPEYKLKEMGSYYFSFKRACFQSIERII